MVIPVLSEIIGQLMMWSISAAIITVMIPRLVLLWIWNTVTDFSGVAKRPVPSRPDPSLYGGGTSQFVQLKVCYNSAIDEL